MLRKNFRPDPRHEFGQLDNSVLLDIAEASSILGISRHTLKSWRHGGRGPPATILGGRAVRFGVGDLRAWLAEQRKAS